MFFRILLAVTDQPCALEALRTLNALSAHPDGELVVLGVVQPFRTDYAHRHPLIGRRIRNLLWQVTGDQTAEAERLVSETLASFRSLGWDVRGEVREGPIVEEVFRCCGALCPQLLIVGSCLAEATGLWGPRAIWQEVARKVACPVLVVKHTEAELSVKSREMEVRGEAAVPQYGATASHAVGG